MSQERFALQLLKSSTSGTFYQKMTERRFSEALRYFSLLILFVTLVLSVRFTFDIVKGLSQFEAWSQENLPEITILKGKVSVNVSQPWQKEEEGIVMIIDTTGKTAEIGETYSRGVLLTQNRLFVKKNPYEIQGYDLSKVESFHLNAETIRRWRKVGQWCLPPLFSLILFVYFWTGKFLQVLVFSGVSVLTNWIAKRGLSYRTLLTVGIYAMTLPFLLASGAVLWGLQVRLLDLVCFSMYAALLVTVILHCYPKMEEMPGEF